MNAFSFDPTIFGQSSTPLDHHVEPSPHRHRCCNFTCHCLVFTSSDDESPERSSEQCSPPPSADTRSPTPREADISSSLHHVTPTTNPFQTDNGDDVSSSFDKHFPTAPLDDDICTEEEISDRCLCIHEKPHDPNHHCPTPVHMAGTPSSGLTYYNQCHDVKQGLTMIQWTSVTYHQIFQIS